jgi:hypothetical protein
MADYADCLSSNLRDSLLRSGANFVWAELTYLCNYLYRMLAIFMCSVNTRQYVSPMEGVRSTITF